MTTKQLNFEIEVIAVEGWFPGAAPARQSLHPGESATVDVTFRVVGDFDDQLWLSTASVQQRILAACLVPKSPEFEVEHGGVRYVAQRAEHLGTGEVRVCYAPVSNDSDVAFVARP